MYIICFIAGYAACQARVFQRLRDQCLHLWAKARGGQWFLDLQQCRGCGRRGHLMVHRSGVLEAGLEDDSGYRCPACAKGVHR